MMLSWRLRKVIFSVMFTGGLYAVLQWDRVYLNYTEIPRRTGQVDPGLLPGRTVQVEGQ